MEQFVDTNGSLHTARDEMFASVCCTVFILGLATFYCPPNSLAGIMDQLYLIFDILALLHPTLTNHTLHVGANTLSAVVSTCPYPKPIQSLVSVYLLSVPCLTVESFNRDPTAASSIPRPSWRGGEGRGEPQDCA